jgi:protein required for attachment to host cells
LQLDIRTRAQAAFTKEVFGHVRGLLHDGSYESYVLIAPSRMLTLMRSMMDSELEAALIGTLAKNLTKVPDHRLLDHLRPISLKSAPRPANGLYS